MEEFNENIEFAPIERKMNKVHIVVSAEKFKHIPEYMKKYCDGEVYTRKKMPRVHGCGCNHGSCKLCDTPSKKIHKERIWSKSFEPV